MKVAVYSEADKALVRDMWSAGATLVDIAAALNRQYSTADSARASITGLARKLGLPRRDGLPRKIADAGGKTGVQVSAPPALPSEPEKMEAPAAHPFWTPSRDAMILRTEGRYAEIATVAEALDKPIAAVLQRWHQVRAA